MEDGDGMRGGRRDAMPEDPGDGDAVRTSSPEAGSVDALAWEPVNDDELAALALAADPSAVPDDDAVPLDDYLERQPGLLPLWYMPRPLARSGSRWRMVVVLAIVAAFLAIEAVGLCSTFGQIVPA
jgi:hypothetical protein